MKYQLTIPKPCHENWSKMTSTEKGKFCKSCAKEVIDFTKLSNSDISKTIGNQNNICGRFTTNQLNTDLEVKKRNKLPKVAAGLAILSSIVSTEPAVSQTQKDTITVLNNKDNTVFITKDKNEKHRIIKGKVKDQYIELPGASIVLKGTSLTTETDFDGNFSLKIPYKKAKKTILVISYLGYKTQEIDILSITKPLLITLEENSELLGEVVTVGMVTVKRPNIFKRIGNLFRKKENRKY